MENLARRAAILADVRRFFAERGVLEVDTPVLARTTVTDPAIDSIAVPIGADTWYLQTSPEFHMKRLLAAGAPAIVRIGPVYRAGEAGRIHNPEFTMVEWYRPGFDAARLQREVADLVDRVLGAARYERVAYDVLLHEAFGVDPARASAASLDAALERAGIVVSAGSEPDSRAKLDLLFDAAVRRRGGRLFVDEFPFDQAALARTRLRDDGRAVADRFELVIDGVEIANGYMELTDAAVLEERIAADAKMRTARGSPVPPADARLLDAMRAGLPDMSGVALGFDRLVMLSLGATTLAEVVAFPFTRA